MKNLKIVMTFIYLLTFCPALNAVSSAEENLLSVLDAAEKHNLSMIFEKPSPFPVYDGGSEKWVNYEKYGKFINAGTEKYVYEISDLEGLKAASGEGIYPNTQSVLNSPDYKTLERKLKGNKWKFVNNENYQTNFYKWAVVNEDPGIKLYYAAFALEKSGNFAHAVKAYYACVVFFPMTVGYTQWQTPWYIAPACVARIKHITREHPELGVKLEGADIRIKNIFDNDTKNDVFYVNPGKLIPSSDEDFKRKYTEPESSGIKKTEGNGKVRLIQYNNGNFRLNVNGKPYVIRGISYSPSKIGLSPDYGTLNNLRDWSYDDYNKNKKIDGPYDAMVDANRNEKKNDGEYSVGDFALMKEMGINTLRLYHYADLNKELLKDGYEKYGFMYLMGNLVGMYGIDSNAGWYDGTDYTDREQKQHMLNSIRNMVEEYKDEPYILMWVLGNENNYGSIGEPGVSVGSACKAPKQPEAYYAFINECAKLIKSLDSQKRPVAISNGDLYLLDYCAKNAPEIDVYGANVYRGEAGFGPVWQDVAREYGKAVLITEYGCPAYAKKWDIARIEAGQADYHRGNWNDIEDNLAGIEGGAGNALGGVIFSWVDEWWKAGPAFDASMHDTESQWEGPFLDGKAYEEWFGLCSQGNGRQSPFKRQLRKAYFMYRDLWEKYKNKN